MVTTMRTAAIAFAALAASVVSLAAPPAHADPSFSDRWEDPYGNGPAPGQTEVRRVDAAASAPQTQETPLSRRTQIGLRLGYARATGGVSTRGAMSELVPATLPITLDFGRFVGSHVYLGGAAGFMGTFRECGPCKGRGVSLAFMARYHFRRASTVDPWLSLSSGFDVLHLSYGATSSSSEARLGWATMFGAGVDLRAAPWLVTGPYVGLGPSVELATIGRSSRPTVPVGQAVIGFRGAFEVL
jgi:hypothetical protein